MMPVTAQQLHLLHHALGVQPDRREPYRNYFVAGDGYDDQFDLQALEAAGLMRRGRTPAFCDPGDVVFHCTDAGRTYALNHLLQPPKRSRYDEFLAYDGGYSSFAEFLGIELPRREYRHTYHINEGQIRLVSSRATGGWAATVKAAKTSYKAALRERRQRYQQRVK